MMYNELVYDCFFSPQHVGSIDLTNHLSVVFNNTQKDQGSIELYLQCNPDGTIVRACFKTNGNPYVIASLEWLCRQVEGKILDKVPQIDYPMIVRELGIPHMHYPVVVRVMDVYQEVIFLMKKKVGEGIL